MRWMRCGMFAVMLLCGAGVLAQEIRLGEGRAAVRQHVFSLTDAVQVKAGREQVVELRFRVQEGYHINSHTPKDGLLVPTSLQLDAVKEIAVQGAVYPAGTEFKLKVGDGELLDVYEGEFRVQVRLAAEAGSSMLTGSLRYQACDSAACFPPRVLPVAVVVTAR